MASDENRTRYRILPIAICAVASVLVSIFLGARFLRKKRGQHGYTGGTSAGAVQQQQKHEDFDGSHNVPSTSSSVDPETGHEFEVFLSFRGSDNRKKFTDCLYYGLTDAGIRTFRDNEELPVGEDIGPKLMKSIKQSKIAIPIFSKDYASSKWCLKEVEEIVKCKTEIGQLIMPVFLDVTPDEVQHQTGSYANSFSEHEKRFDPEMVRGWRNALKEVVKLKGLELSVVTNGNEGEFIRFIVARVIRQLKKSYLEVNDTLVGIEDRAEQLMKKLEVGINDIRVVGVWGMGGIGKTTLAKFVYNQIVDKFESNSFLSNIRETSKTRGLQYLQSKLASNILSRDREDFANVEEGIGVLKERLRDKKALILLDDVDHIDQLKALAADVKWFGHGSRIIITTREKQLLDRFHVQDLYEVALMDKYQALELFCQHAFGDKLPRTDFVELAWDIVNITGRLPLALEVIGSSLSICGGKKDIWISTVKKLQMNPNMDVQHKLMISYESLGHQEREIFLDIACFFIGMDVRLVIPMWKDVNLFPEIGIEILLLKSLIKIREDNTIWMHDQLKDLGRYIVEQGNYKEPGKRSRLWRSEDGVNVILGQQGTSKVEAISLEGHCFLEHTDCLTDEMFENLRELRFLELDGGRLTGNFQHRFQKLRWLGWHRDNENPPPGLTLENLIVLDLSRSLTPENCVPWSSIKIGVQLKVLNLRNCRISRTPDFSAFPSLEILIFESCKDLVCVDPSIGLLKNLLLLDLRICWSLKELPKQIGSMESLVEFLIDYTEVEEAPISGGMKKLEILSANGCRYLREIPASIGSLMNLKRLSLVGCSGLDKLPDSIGQLTTLVELTLSVTNLRSLPNFVGSLHELETLKIDNTDITCLPGNLGSLKRLELLDASWHVLEGEREISNDVLGLSSLRILKFCGVKSLPQSMKDLSCLQTLHLKDCPNLQALPELPSSLISLTVEASSKLTFLSLANLVNLRELSLLKDFELKEVCLPSLGKLEKLCLRSAKICSLPEEMSSFHRLKEMDISDCRQLKCIPTLPSSLSFLRFNQCDSLERLPDLSNLTNLSKLEVASCSKIKEIEGLGNLRSLKVLWTYESPVNKLDGLERLEFLSEISASYSEVERLPDLSKLRNLQRLDLSMSSKLVEIQGLGSLQKLKYLFIQGCSSLEFLPELPTCLEQLSLRECQQFSQIQAIEALESLQYLDISGCKGLRKLPNLSRLQRLEYIRMRECENITEIPGLEELSNLRRLSIFGCKALKLPDLSKQESNGLRINYTTKQW